MYISERALVTRHSGRGLAFVGGCLLSLLPLLATACSGGLPGVNLRAWAYSQRTSAARRRVTARIDAAVAALTAAHLVTVGEAVADYCGRWDQLQENGNVMDWGVTCARETDLFGGFSKHPAAELASIERILERHGWGHPWRKALGAAQCGNYSHGSESQVLSSESLGPYGIRAEVNVSPSAGRTVRGNINYILGCAECGPDAFRGYPYPGLLPPIFYVQHSCPPEPSIASALSGQAGMWHVEFFDGGYAQASAQGSNPLPTQSPLPDPVPSGG